MTTGTSSLQTVGELGEFGLIDVVAEQLGTGPLVLIGPGDDAAHVATGPGGTLMSTDLLIEGRHFRRDWSSAREIGLKAAACNLSDINAMGGTATALTIGFGAPADLPVQWAADMARGFSEESARVGAHVVGGDVTASDAIVIAVTVIGEAERVVRRDGARPGDLVAVAGRTGLAGAGFAALSRGFRSPKAAVEAHRIPQPPYAAGPQASAAGATAMTDVSDGLLADLGHVAAASGVGVDIDPTAFTVAEAVLTVAEALQIDPLTFVLTGGDDYGLVATFSPSVTVPSDWTIVGSVHEGSGVTVAGAAFEGAAGHQHWS
jgi:thiamine-monophosphate kinase